MFICLFWLSKNKKVSQTIVAIGGDGQSFVKFQAVCKNGNINTDTINPPCTSQPPV